MGVKTIIFLILTGLVNLSLANRGTHKGVVYLNIAEKYQSVDNERALAYIDSCTIVLNETPNTKLLFRSLSLKSLIYLNQGKFKEAFIIAQQIKPYYLKNEDYNALSYSHFITGEFYQLHNRYHEAIDEYIQSSIYCEQTKNNELLMQVKGELAVNLYLLGQYQESENLLIEVRNFAQNERNDDLMLHCLHYLARIYENDPSKSITFYKRAIPLASGDRLAKINTELANKYLSIQKNDSALHYLYQSLSAKTLDPFISINAYIGFARVFESMRLSDSAKYYLQLLNIQYRATMLPNHEKEYHYTLSKLEANQQSYQQAYKQLLEAYMIKDSTYSAGKDSDFKAFEESFYNKQKVKNAENLSIEHALQKKKLKDIQFNNLLLSLFSIALIALILIAFYFSQKHKKLYRTIKLKNTQINRKNIELKNTITTRDRLISVIAHDIKNPLGTISGFADLIGMNEGSVSKMKKYAKLIYHSTVNLQVLLDNLLEWARSQKENISITPTHLNVNQIIESTLDILKPIANDSKVRIENRSKIHHNIMADENTVSTIIRNITSNAIKFSNPNSSIVISTQSDDKHIIISIQDSGIGIQKDDIPKLFKQDVDREAIGDHPKKGTGVGLLLCKEFVDLNDGKIVVDSELGKGSIFNLHFPKSTIDQN